MKEIESISAALFDKIRSRFPSVTLGNEKAKAETDPTKARFFNFTYTDDQGNKYTKITISLINETGLKVYYSQNIVADMDMEQRKNWYEFLRNLRQFARRNLLTFDTRDINKSNLALQDVKQQANVDNVSGIDDVVPMSESRMYGTSKFSYADLGETRLRIQHVGTVSDEVRGDRSRKIEKIFIETSGGERFLVPFKNLHGARAMAQHVGFGGNIRDERGQHICEMVKEMAAMSHFVRSTKRRQFEDQETADMSNAAVQHYEQIKGHLKRMHSPEGFHAYFDCWDPTPGAQDDEVDINALRERFVKKVYDDRFNDALPYVYRAHQMYKENLGEYGTSLDEWATKVTESAWAKPDTAEKVRALRELLKTPILVGINGVDAKYKIEEIIGDDDLNNAIEQLADSQGPDADATTLVKKWLVDHMPGLLKDLEIGKNNSRDSQTNWAQPVSPASAHSDEYAAGNTPGDNSHNMAY
jgi:hypothetical protein